MKDEDELTRKMAEAKQRVAKMSKAEYDAMIQAQRESFARGMGPCEHGLLDFEDCPECRAKAGR